MLIAGAGGHAVELLEVLRANKYKKEICFFDDQNKLPEKLLYSKYTIITSVQEVAKYFMKQPEFCIGIGNPALRKLINEKLAAVGGKLVSVISNDALIGSNEVVLGNGLNIMQGAIIISTTTIGKGSLIHVNSSVHHDTTIGEYCELSPGCRILGGSILGNFVSIGSNAVVMRNISIGDNAIIGAGAVVTKNVKANTTVVGIPAKEIIKSN